MLGASNQTFFMIMRIATLASTTSTTSRLSDDLNMPTSLRDRPSARRSGSMLRLKAPLGWGPTSGRDAWTQSRYPEPPVEAALVRGRQSVRRTLQADNCDSLPHPLAAICARAALRSKQAVTPASDAGSGATRSPHCGALSQSWHTQPAAKSVAGRARERAPGEVPGRRRQLLRLGGERAAALAHPWLPVEYMLAVASPAEHDADCRAVIAGDPTRCGGEHHGLDMLRSEEHTSELQSLMRISSAVFCLK